MSKSLSYQLFELIKRLSKAEKRHFKLYAKHNGSGREEITVKLFDVFDKQKKLDEEKLVKNFPTIKTTTLSHHKSQLYKQLLSALKTLHSDTATIRIKEMLITSEVLHDKGLYRQSLSYLNKAKRVAKKEEWDILRLEIIELEKVIETRYVTSSASNRANLLINESKELRKRISDTRLWSDLALQLYDYYLKFGHVRSVSQYEFVAHFFEENRPKKMPLHRLDMIFYYQSYVWYYHIIQDFVLSYKYSKKWVAFFLEKKSLIKEVPEMFIRGYHNILSSLFFCDDVVRYRDELAFLEAFIEQESTTFNENQRIQSFTSVEIGRMNLFFMEGTFSEGAKYCQDFEKKLEKYESSLDVHHKIIFYYKMACLKFGDGDFHGALRHLNTIINSPFIQLKEDFQSYARFLSLIVHYELGNDDIIYFQIKSTYRFMLKLKDFQKVHESIFRFLKKSIYINRKKLNPHFRILRDELTEIIQDKYERRPMLYLDIISWLESKIYDKPIKEIIRGKKLLSGA